MCKLVKITNSLGEQIEVAEIKADTIKKIIKTVKICDKIDYIYLFGSSVEERCTDELYPLESRYCFLSYHSGS